MAHILIGLGRFYAAHAIDEMQHDRTVVRTQLGATRISVGIGAQTSHGIMCFASDPAQPRDSEVAPWESRRPQLQHPPAQVFPADAYVEIVATEKLEVEDGLAQAFENRDPDARTKVFKLSRSREAALRLAIDFAAGVIGLHVHSLLVSNIVTEQVYAYRSENNTYAYRAALSIEVTESIPWDGPANALCHAAFDRANKMSEASVWEESAEALAWLVRAWGARDPVLRFVSLFIPLEMVIPSLAELDEQFSWPRERLELSEFLQHLDAADARVQKFVEFVTKLQPPGPLTERFAKWQRGWRCRGGKVMSRRSECSIRNAMHLFTGG